MAGDVDRPRLDYSGRDADAYSREELDALLRAAASEQDRAIFLTAALTGLRRSELVALRWRDVDFPGRVLRMRQNYSHGQVTTPKSGEVRSVPLVDEVARALDGLSRRERFTGDDDPVFAGLDGGYMDASALGRRYSAAVKRAGIRFLTFHSLRHHFGSEAINAMTPVEVQQLMGYADLHTTSRYMHAKSRADDAERLARAFGREPVEHVTDDLGRGETPQANTQHESEGNDDARSHR